jgi:hypothetical protein
MSAIAGPERSDAQEMSGANCHTVTPTRCNSLELILGAVIHTRTPEWRTEDPVNARAFEREVRAALGPLVIDRTSSFDDLDFEVVGFRLEVKEKRQPIGQRWLTHAPGVDPDDLFIIDELSVRKALAHWPACYFLLHDAVLERLFLASITELCVVPRTRVLRAGKSKLLYDLKEFRQISCLDDVVGVVRDDLLGTPWQISGAVGICEPTEV